MSSSRHSSLFLLGQRPRRPYVNRFSRFFFTELDKGITSPYILLSTSVLISYLAWRITMKYVRPQQAFADSRRRTQKIHFDPQHNQFWGISGPSGTGGAGTRQFGVQAESDAKEDAQRRPQLVATEVSERREKPTAAHPTGELDIVCMELAEFDPDRRSDVYYRSLHYVRDSTLGDPSSVESKTDQSLSPSASAAPSAASYYYARMPTGGLEVLHGITKCTAISALHNCLPEAGRLESEVGRKLALALAPVHVVVDPLQRVIPRRFTFVKQPPVETLVLGMHSGEFPRWLSRSFPNFNVDVVEEDGALVRLCRHYMGWQDTSNLHLIVGEHASFLRSLAARVTSDTRQVAAGIKRYDLVVMDAVDGLGRLSTQYGRLELLNHLRNCLTERGCVAVTLPNKDANFLYHMVQNWRMAFSGRHVILVHCQTSPTTVLFTFQDTGSKGKVKIGTIASVAEYQDLLRAHLSHYGSNRVLFDITGEMSEGNCVILDPQKVYEPEAYLPMGHPHRAAVMSHAATSHMGWSKWLRRLVNRQLTASQRTDLYKQQQ